MELNLYFWIILATVVGLHLLDTIAESLNLKALRPELPDQFKDVFDQEKYAKSQNYTRETTRFGILESTFHLILFLGFWFLGGFGWLDGIIRGWGFGSIVNGLLFFSVLYLTTFLSSLPFTIHDTFKIEAKYGFNKTTKGTFIADQIRGLALGALIGLPLLALILWLFESVENAWLWAWIAVTVFMLLMVYLAPRFIMPLYNKFSPLDDEALKAEIAKMSEECEFPLQEVQIMDGSKRSAKSNAFFTGFGKNRKIALFDTLVEKHTHPELVAVLAHEIGHFKRKHILQGIGLSILQVGIIFFLLGLFVNNDGLCRAFGVEQTSTYASFVFFLMLYKPVGKVLSIGMSILSRKNEFEADAYAAEVTGSPESLVSALKKLSSDNLSNLTPHPFYVFMNYSHPPMTERLAALEQA
ncbi:MAG: M48 family metallopeptidase [Verrucomicrobiota bacterium]